MPARIFGFIALYFAWCVIAEVNVTTGRKLYISRSGDDTWSCEQSKPCKNIWRAVTLASDGDHIHLDGTDTSRDPYPCQPRTEEHPGIYINKSLSLIGSTSPMPQIRCTEGTSLRFVGSDETEQMNVTLSGLLVNESFVSVQDSSLHIDSCEFGSSKQGLEILIQTSMVLSINITNSAFSGSSECISVVFNSTKISSQKSQIMFNLANSSFVGNVLSDEGTCISFIRSRYSTQSMSCNISLEKVTFFRNKFSSKGLVFLDMDNSNSHLQFQNVIFIANSPSSDQHVLVGNGGSECIVRSIDVSICITSSNFTSQRARLFNVSASRISLQIYNSTFSNHRVKGNGGVISLGGTELCKLNVTESSFFNTSADQGGAMSINCAHVDAASLRNNTFAHNTARNGRGGAVYIYSQYSKNDKPELYSEGQSVEPSILQVSIIKCVFTSPYSSYGGGAVFIKAFKASMRLCHSTFVNCTAVKGGGGGLYVDTGSMSPNQSPGSDFRLHMDSSRFIGCSGGASGFGNGGSLSVLYKTQVEISINNSRFISNHATFGGAIYISPPYSDERWRRNASFLSIESSIFLKNTADGEGGAISLMVSNHSTVILRKLLMELNKAQFSGGALDVGINSLPTPFILKIYQSRFLKNTAHEFGGAISVNDVNILEIQDSLFDGDYAWNSILRPEEYGRGALYINCRLISTSIVIFNTTFKNCSARLQGGAIYLSHKGNLSLEVKMCQFTENFVLPGELGHGGAILFLLAPDTETNPGCVRNELASSAIRNDDPKGFPSWVYKSHLVFEDTTFEKNSGDAGGAVYLTNGKAIFRNCFFIDNFGMSQGGHIYTEIGSASVVVQDSVFRQTMNELQVLTMKFYDITFFYAESSGALKLYNTTMDATLYGSTGPLMLVTNGRLIDLGVNNFTTFYCPVGSQMEKLHFAKLIMTQVNNKPCKINVSTLEFSCSACAGNTYSLQRGRALGSQVAPGFQCLPCPFGANCSRNILAKPNFWGFEEQLNPPTLKFTMCPLGYCSPPNETDFPEYNGCQGNRSGKLCGQCNESYTETLYSTNCRPSYDCKDYWFWPVALLYVSLMALYFTFRPPFVPWIKRQILWFKNNETTNEENDFDRGYLKIIFHFYQAANLLLVSNLSQRIFETKFVDVFVGLFNFQQTFSSSGLVCPFPGLTAVTKQLFSASHVFGTSFMICVIYCFHWGVQKCRHREAPSVGPYIGGILQTVLLGYTTLTSVSFNLLRCVDIGSDKRLFYDGNVLCFQWWQYILIGFVCVYFVPFVFVLFWGCFKLYGGTISVGKFLLACCFPLPSFLYWAFLCLFRKMNNSTNNDSPPSEVTSLYYVERVLYDCFKRPEDGRKLSLSWESVMIGRRLILIVLKALIADPLPRLLFMVLFCVLFLQHHSMTQPFRDGIANTVETIFLLSIVVLATANMFFASFLSLAVPVNHHFSSWWNVCQGAEIVIICALPVVFCILVVATVLSLMCRITFIVCRFLYNVCWICFIWCFIKQNDETRPMVSVS